MKLRTSATFSFRKTLFIVITVDVFNVVYRQIKMRNNSIQIHKTKKKKTKILYTFVLYYTVPHNSIIFSWKIMTISPNSINLMFAELINAQLLLLICWLHAKIPFRIAESNFIVNFCKSSNFRHECVACIAFYQFENILVAFVRPFAVENSTEAILSFYAVHVENWSVKM